MAIKLSREPADLFQIVSSRACGTAFQRFDLQFALQIRFGQVSLGACGYHVGKSLALGHMSAIHASPGTKVQVAMLDRPHDVPLLDEPAFDPAGKRLRN